LSNRLSNRLSNLFHNRFDNRLYCVYKHSMGCQTGLTTGWMFVYTIQPIVKPVVQPAVSCKRGLRNRGLKLEIVDDDHVFLEKRPFKGKFSKNYSEKIHHVTESRLVCKFHEIWLTRNRQSRVLFT